MNALDPVARLVNMSVENDRGCWIFTGSRNPKGYGRMGIAGKTVQTHRFAFEYFRVEIPAGLVIDHVVCQNPPCWNPWHLEPVTSRVNSQRGEWANKPLCAQGHEYSGRNLIIQISSIGTQRRLCRACNVAAHDEWRSRNPRAPIALAPDDPRHGTLNGYTHGACRCRACTDQATAYARERRARANA